MRFRRRSGLIGCALCLLGTACGDDVLSDAEGPGKGGDDGNAGGPGEGSDGGALPPEDEETLGFDAPQAGKTVVYIPNPLTNRVAVVNARTFEIETVAPGRAPTYAATVPGRDVAVVVNVASQDAAILRTVRGRTAIARVAVGHAANVIAIAPDGLHALLYFDARFQEGLSDTFQDVTVVNLRDGEESSRGVSIGFRPRSVQFSADGQKAFVITEDGISNIDLNQTDDGPAIAPLVSLGDRLQDAVSSDVQITPDGLYALARREGDAKIRRIELATGAIQTLALTDLQATRAGDGGVDGGDDAGADGGAAYALLPAGPLDLSDLDIAPDGSFALAVIRNAGVVLRIPLPGGFDDVSTITARAVEEQLVGQVTIASSGELAIGFSTAARTEGVVLIDLTSEAAPVGIRLRKSVRAVALSADSTRAVVLHGRSNGDANAPGLDEDERIDRSEGYSLIDTTSGFTKLKLTSAAIEPSAVVVTADATRMFAALRDDEAGVRAVECADLESFQVSTLTLAKPPSSIGLVPGTGRVFVGQASEGGMITFLDAELGEVVRAVSGFELSSRIRQ